MGEKKSRVVNPGPYYMLATGLFFSIGGLCMKVVPWNALAINSVRCVLSAMVMGIYVAISGGRLKFNKTIFKGALTIAFTTAVYAMAVKLTTAGAAIVIQFTAPVWVMLFSLLIYKKKPLKEDIITCIVVFFGIGLCFYDGLAAGRTLGNLLALVSGVTYGLVFMWNAGENADATSSVIIGQLMSAAVGIPFLLKESFSALEPVALLCLFVLGVFQLGLGYVFMVKGLKTTPPVTACLITGIEPVLNPIWVALFYDEKITPLFVAGGVLVLVSVTVYNIRAAKRS